MNRLHGDFIFLMEVLFWQLWPLIAYGSCLLVSMWMDERALRKQGRVE